MTEAEKAAAGFLYDANYDSELAEMRAECAQRCWEYNRLNPAETAQMQDMIRRLFRQAGADCVIMQPFRCDYGFHISVGDHFFANYNCIMLDAADITFGDYVFIAPNCVFTTAGHAIDEEQRNRGLEIALPISVGNSVWFGANVTVLPGVTVGDNVIVGAGSVVTGDIPSGVIAVGSPCRVLRRITEEDKRKYPVFQEQV